MAHRTVSTDWDAELVPHGGGVEADAWIGDFKQAGRQVTVQMPLIEGGAWQPER
ncbi:hypothetical protein V6U90_32645 [Micromonospora sp. CPCC 206060]|uniref:hypothetical protein n=1 Tax=Micromonospora sp. CPCC 206060 TaxID=3122406 RepID=UPI002FF1A43C